MAALRGQFLKASLSDLGVAKHANLGRVGGVLVDWPMEHTTVSVVALVDGSASLYTTGSYGVLGGGGHEAVRAAALRCVRAGEKLYDSATSTSDHSLPGTNQVRFFLQGQEGLRVVNAETAALASGKDPRTVLWNEVQVLIGELRLIEEETQGGKTRPR